MLVTHLANLCSVVVIIVVLLTMFRCSVLNGVHMVCADESVPAVKVAVLTSKSPMFQSVQLPVSTASCFI